MSFDKDYYEKLEDYYKDMLNSMNKIESKCPNCDNIHTNMNNIVNPNAKDK